MEMGPATSEGAMSLADSSTADLVSGGGTNAERAYDIVHDRLIMLDIRPGEPINDDRLGEELGFGRTPVREALKRLERERLVVATRVAEPSPPLSI